MSHFKYSLVSTVACVLIALYWGGLEAVAIVLLLGVLEISLSFDNAVVNATVLQEMSEQWQQIFLTIGILIAVFGMRLLFPVLIVSLATGMDFSDVVTMAFQNPDEYAHHLQNSHIQIAMFGGAFLMLVFLNFLIDQGKEIHWFRWFERRMARLGRIDGVAVMLVLATILTTQLVLDGPERLPAVVSGVAGVILYIVVGSFDVLLSNEENPSLPGHVGVATRSGIAGFIYLEVLDASFSFDGVIGAFAISKDVVIIMLGLGIGALFVRSLTIFMVHKGTLQEYVFLEHGAHYAIGCLAIIMFATTKYHIPEVVTGLIGVGFIGLSVLSSIGHRQTEGQA